MSIQHILQLFSQDVAPLGLLSAPLISWGGSAGLIIFFLWQVTRLYQQSTNTVQPFSRVSPLLAKLAHEREQLDRETFALHPPGAAKTKPRTTTAQLDRRDGKDFEQINAVLEKEPWLSYAWKQYRKSLVTEHVAWYIEPRIFSSRPAQELFSLETIFQGRLNLAWYQQVPSLLTGIGLLLTFIALLVGLSKLHADGHGIAGIQGLINGLAGKFLTSIVGLVCATLFTLIEKPLMFRLLSAHQHFTHLIDDLFPRKTLEQILEGMGGISHRPLPMDHSSRHAGSLPHSQASSDTLTQPLKAMTQSLDSLTREIRTYLHAEKAPSITLPSETVVKAFTPLLEQFTIALKQLPREPESQPALPATTTEQVHHLVDDLTTRITHSTHSSLTGPIRQSQGWLQRLRDSTGLLAPQPGNTLAVSQTRRGPR